MFEWPAELRKAERFYTQAVAVFSCRGGGGGATRTVLLCLWPRCGATLQCHPVPAVMGEGCGGASHQYSATGPKHRNTENAAYLHKQEWLAYANTMTQVNKHALLRVHICTPIGIVRSVSSDKSSPHDSFHTHNMGFLCFPKPRHRKARAAQRLYWAPVGINLHTIHRPFVTTRASWFTNISQNMTTHWQTLYLLRFLLICLNEKSPQNNILRSPFIISKCTLCCCSSWRTLLVPPLSNSTWSCLRWRVCETVSVSTTYWSLSKAKRSNYCSTNWHLTQMALIQAHVTGYYLFFCRIKTWESVFAKHNRIWFNE